MLGQPPSAHEVEEAIMDEAGCDLLGAAVVTSVALPAPAVAAGIGLPSGPYHTTSTTCMVVRKTHARASEPRHEFAARRSQNGGGLTSFEFCCGSKMPTGSCEVQAEQLPTTDADPDSKIRCYEGALVLNMHR